MFFTGPPLPDSHGCAFGSLVTLDYTGSEAVLVGCTDLNGFYERGIYNLTWDKWGPGEGEHFQWQTMSQELKYTRTQAVAMMIPRSMTDCRLDQTKKRPTFFQGPSSTFLEKSKLYPNTSIPLSEKPHNPPSPGKK